MVLLREKPMSLYLMWVLKRLHDLSYQKHELEAAQIGLYCQRTLSFKSSRFCSGLAWLYLRIHEKEGDIKVLRAYGKATILD